MKNILLVTLLFISQFINGQTVDFALGQKTIEHFDCNYYNYFSDTALPVVTKEDSLKLQRYSEKFQKIMDQHGYYKAYHLFQYFPYIEGEIDTVWIEKLENETTFNFLSLDYTDVNYPISSNGLILGRVVDKFQSNDTSRCLFYTTMYVVEAIDVIHSYFEIHPGNKVLIYDIMGYGGGCFKGGENMKSKFSHIKEYDIGEESLFLLNRSIYQNSFRYRELNTKYEDIYCPQAFRMHLNNFEYDSYSRKKIKDLKLFFNTEFKYGKK